MTVTVGGRSTTSARRRRCGSTALPRRRRLAGGPSLFPGPDAAARRPERLAPRRPRLVPRPQSDELTERLSTLLPQPRRAQIVARGGFRIIPSQPGERRPAAAHRLAGDGGADGGADALARATHVEPELTTPAAEAAVEQAKALVDEPVTLTFKGQEVGTLQPAAWRSSSASVRPVTSFRVSFDPQRIAKAVEPMLKPWRARAVNARFVVDGTRVHVRPSRLGLAVDGPWVADSAWPRQRRLCRRRRCA